MTDLSSKGLLPQLVHVLRSLADSQELLTQRIRSASLEHIRVHSTPTPTPTLNDDARDRLSVNAGELTREPQQRDTAESTWPQDGPRTQRDGHERTLPGAVPVELANRDYNFFDELDTRLATLLRPEVADEN